MSFFARLRIGQRLALVFGSVITAFLSMAAVAVVSIGGLKAEIVDIVNGRYPNTVLANRLKGEISDASRGMMSMLIMTDEVQTQKEIASVQALMKAHDETLERLTAQTAGEVRSLAQRGAGAAREIKTLIADSVEKVAQGSALVSRAGSKMEGVVHSVQRVAAIVGEIADASRQQSAGIEAVNATIYRIDAATQRNAALVEQAAAAAASLQQQAAGLEGTVSLFKLESQTA